MSGPVSLSLVVLRCADLDRSRAFYEYLGLSFGREQHERGPAHYACMLDGIVIELYPKGAQATSGVRLGFTIRRGQDIVDGLVERGGKLLADSRPSSITILDPDGHTLDLTLLSEA